MEVGQQKIKVQEMSDILISRFAFISGNLFKNLCKFYLKNN